MSKVLPRAEVREALRRAVARWYGVDPLAVGDRHRHTVLARHALAYLLRTRLGCTLREVGDYLGLDTASVVYAVGKVAGWPPGWERDAMEAAWREAVQEVRE